MKPVNDSLLREVVRRLVDQFQPEQIILFGSQVWGVPTRGSDIDLLVILSESSLSEYERAVLGHRCLSGLDIAKDVIVRTRKEFDFFKEARASLEHKIAHQGKVLYDRRESPTRAQLAHQG
jgi:predicted nucleotidyltransferase